MTVSNEVHDVIAFSIMKHLNFKYIINLMLHKLINVRVIAVEDKN